MDGPPRRVVRAARLVLKDAAFELLHTMVALLDHYSLDRPDSASLDAQLIVIMNAFLTRLRARMAGTVIEITPVLHDTDTELLSGEYTRWANTDSWQLINTADPCGT